MKNITFGLEDLETCLAIRNYLPGHEYWSKGTCRGSLVTAVLASILLVI